MTERQRQRGKARRRERGGIVEGQEDEMMTETRADIKEMSGRTMGELR